jgi:hypothetical protein
LALLHLFRNATLHVQTAARYGQKLRITEANSLSGAGEEGTSDTFAAALWTADMSFEFVAAGVHSLHYHWGHGGTPEVGALGGAPVYAGGQSCHPQSACMANNHEEHRLSK